MSTTCALPTSAGFHTPQTLSRTLEARREYVRGELKAVCSRTLRPRILSVGNGALREAESILPLIEEQGGEFVVLDGNEDSLCGLQNELGCGRIHAVPGDPFTARRSELGAFHLVYALNLMNELSDVAAMRLLTRLASLLRRGGSLLVSNFSTVLADSAYFMPSLQRAFLRTEEDVARLTELIPDRDMLGQIVWTDDSGALVYLEVQK